MAHYYEVVLEKIDETDAKLALRPALTPEDIDRILDIAEEMDSEFVGEDDDYNFDTLKTPKTVHLVALGFMVSHRIYICDYTLIFHLCQALIPNNFRLDNPR